MRPVRILVATLDPAIATDLRQSLTRLGHAITATASSLAEAVHLAREQAPDLLLLDARLPVPPKDQGPGGDPLTDLSLPVVYLAPREGLDDEQLAAILETALGRHQAEQALQRRAARLAVTLDSIPVATLVTGPEGRVTFLNPAAEALTGWTWPEALGRALTEVSCLLDVDTHQPLALGLHGPEERAALLRARGGHEVPVQVTTAPCQPPDLSARRQGDRSAGHEAGSTTGNVVLLRDVTAVRRLEEHVRQARTMEAVGQLAGGVAHDFNNLLTVITGYSSLLLTAVSADHPWHGFLEEIRKAGERAAELTRQLLAFSRRQMLQPRVLHLNEIITGLTGLLRQLLGPRIELVITLGPSLPPIKADPGQLEQVLVSLTANARDAMPDGGRLTIETASVVLSAAEALTRPGLQPGPCVRLTVTDTGHGMPESVRAHAFEPFFTTKPLGQGIGLGLASVYGTVKQSNGHIEVSSGVGQGTRFTIELPPALEPARPTSGLSLPDLPRGSETILLVVIEPGVCNLNRRVLQLCGYTVLEAGDGVEALQVSVQYSQAIHLLVSDAVLPQMSGRELGALLAAQRPELRVLLLGSDASFSEQQGLLLKPYSPHDLARKVRQVLDTARS